jgi:uncharacterized protein
MTREELKKQVPGYWMKMAEEALAAAELALSSKLFVSCVNRMYYAAFYCACSLLAKQNIEYGKHSAVRVAFHREFVKRGLVDTEFGDMYDQLFNYRQKGDYSAFMAFEANDLNVLLILVKRFTEMVRKAIN